MSEGLVRRSRRRADSSERLSGLNFESGSSVNLESLDQSQQQSLDVGATPSTSYRYLAQGANEKPISEKPTVELQRGDERVVGALFLALAAASAAWHGDVAISLPPLRLILELGMCNILSMSINACLGLAIYFYPRAAPLVFFVTACLLPLPYMLSTAIISHAAPICSVALLLFVGAWKVFDIALGTAATGITSSCVATAMYVASALDFRCSSVGEPLVARAADWLHFVTTFAWHAVGLAALSSCLCLTGEALPYVLRIYGETWCVFYLLSIVGDSLSTILSLCGFVPSILFRDPLTRATCPSDFWGRRWNLLIHGLFKRTIYFPITQRGIPPAAAAMFAFFVSGAFHEYSFLAPVAARAGGASLGVCGSFFVFQAPVITAEKLLISHLGNAAATVGLRPGTTARTVAASLLTTALLVPFAPLFMQTLNIAGVLNEFQQLFPHLVPREAGPLVIWNGWDAIGCEVAALGSAMLS